MCAARYRASSAGFDTGIGLALAGQAIECGLRGGLKACARWGVPLPVQPADAAVQRQQAQHVAQNAGAEHAAEGCNQSEVTLWL